MEDRASCLRTAQASRESVGVCRSEKLLKGKVVFALPVSKSLESLLHKPAPSPASIGFRLERTASVSHGQLVSESKASVGDGAEREERGLGYCWRWCRS